MLKSASHGCFQPFAGLRERKIVVPDEKKVGYAEIYLLMTFSQITVTHFEQLKHGLPLYQDKHHQTTKSHCAIQQESKGFWDYWRLPVQLCPFPVNPGLHVHTYDPCVLLHVASLWHLPNISSHLSVSVVKLEKNKDKKKYMNKISTKDIRFLVSIKEPQELGNSQKPQFICSFLL